MASPSSDTIFAVSSGRGRAGVAVIRISGPGVQEALKALGGDVPDDRVASLRLLIDPTTQEPLDQALVLYFAGPASFTGEDVGELHIHGGTAVMEAVLGALGGLEGLRIAEPGEFTRRAFEAGKIDLTQAEGLVDLIEAETRAQRLQALRQSGGQLKALSQEWRDTVIRAAALVEAAIDFSDEADVPDLIENQARPLIYGLKSTVSEFLKDAERGERLRDGLRIVLAGAPNAGKSSLLNALAKRDAAIVSDEPGTTRDVIEVRLDLDGYPVNLVDTAGLREADGKVEREGMRRTQEQARTADLVLWLVDATDPRWTAPQDFEAHALVTVLNKVDLAEPGSPDDKDPVAISVKSGAGIEMLLDRLSELAEERMGGGEMAVVTRSRQRQELIDCVAALDTFLSGGTDDLELRAEDLRVASRALGRISGVVDVEDILDRIFGDFCIGK